MRRAVYNNRALGPPYFFSAEAQISISKRPETCASLSQATEEILARSRSSAQQFNMNQCSRFAPATLVARRKSDDRCALSRTNKEAQQAFL